MSTKLLVSQISENVRETQNSNITQLSFSRSHLNPPPFCNSTLDHNLISLLIRTLYSKNHEKEGRNVSFIRKVETMKRKTQSQIRTTFIPTCQSE